ncbi:MAG: hypothetical protein M0C28_23665 [Candidatus Moduliflexus flocculans]|nr:hypothetical protein [Candidatus Moduliflexus flocculans]
MLTDAQKAALGTKEAFPGPALPVVVLPGDEEDYGGCLAAGRGFLPLPGGSPGGLPLRTLLGYRHRGPVPAGRPSTPPCSRPSAPGTRSSRRPRAAARSGTRGDG